MKNRIAYKKIEEKNEREYHAIILFMDFLML